MTLFWGLGTPIQVASNRNTVYEHFGPFHIGPCFEVRVKGSDIVALVAVLNISNYVVEGLV